MSTTKGPSPNYPLLMLNKPKVIKPKEENEFAGWPQAGPSCGECGASTLIQTAQPRLHRMTLECKALQLIEPIYETHRPVVDVWLLKTLHTHIFPNPQDLPIAPVDLRVGSSLNNNNNAYKLHWGTRKQVPLMCARSGPVGNATHAHWAPKAFVYADDLSELPNPDKSSRPLDPFRVLLYLGTPEAEDDRICLVHLYEQDPTELKEQAKKHYVDLHRFCERK